MAYDTNSGRTHASAAVHAELMTDVRARIAQEQAEAAERRRAELADQASSRYTARERVRMWERLHGLTLPRQPSPHLMTIVAKDTALTLEQVTEEQQRRVAARSAVEPKS